MSLEVNSAESLVPITEELLSLPEAADGGRLYEMPAAVFSWIDLIGGEMQRAKVAI